ncbi:MAG: hypothetical protein DLM66_12880 [Candidatus Dormiibacter spiritus]|nr:MAG: hypothetical protein DLM66_12880 [Candidatus Dormibacteraeota bacterium]
MAVASATHTLDEAVRRLIAARVEQGLPPTIKDPAALNQIATILRTPLVNGGARPPTRRRARAVAAGVEEAK